MCQCDATETCFGFVSFVQCTYMHCLLIDNEGNIIVKREYSKINLAPSNI